MELDLRQVMDSEIHWADPELHNPCTRFFVESCIKTFPAGRTMSGVGDSYGHFHSWVNEQAHPWNIPPDLTRQMWNLREDRRLNVLLRQKGFISEQFMDEEGIWRGL